MRSPHTATREQPLLITTREKPPPTKSQHSHKQIITLVAQLVKNLPALQETLVRFLYWEDPLEKG